MTLFTIGFTKKTAEKFLALLAERDAEETIPRKMLDGGCLLCSEGKPQKCRRRLVAEYFMKKWPEIKIVHLV